MPTNPVSTYVGGNDHHSIKEMTTTAEEWQRESRNLGSQENLIHCVTNKTSWYLQRWLGFPQCFSNEGLCSTGIKMQLPMKAMPEEYMTVKVRVAML